MSCFDFVLILLESHVHVYIYSHLPHHSLFHPSDDTFMWPVSYIQPLLLYPLEKWDHKKDW